MYVIWYIEKTDHERIPNCGQVLLLHWIVTALVKDRERNRIERKYIQGQLLI